MIQDPLIFTLKADGNAWILETADGNQMTAPKSGNGMNFTQEGISTTISIDADNYYSTIAFGGCTIYCNFQNSKGVFNPIVNGYSKSQTTVQYAKPLIWRKAGAAVAHDYYLVLEENMWDGGAETVVPFNYSETEGYTLDVATIASSTKDKPGFAGEFYVRDGKANHAGHYFVPAQAAAAPARANALSDGNVGFIPDETGFVSVGLKLIDNSANPLAPGTPVYAVSSKLSTQYEEGKYISINQGMLKLTADGDNSKLQIGEATVTGIESVVADADAEVEYYNLQGVRVINPENGLYIRRQGNTATKVYIK